MFTFILDDNNVFIDERGATRIKIVENCCDNFVECYTDVRSFIIIVDRLFRQKKHLKLGFDKMLQKVLHRLLIL